MILLTKMDFMGMDIKDSFFMPSLAISCTFFLKKIIEFYFNYFYYRFQHPGCLHEVYTPIPSIVRGGHFYNYNSLHLTEVSRAIDYMTNASLSNQTHNSTPLTLVMMMLALPLYNDYRKINFFIF